MFPLQNRRVSGYTFGSPTFYSAHHLGVDYGADHSPLPAPFNGIILFAFTGPEGGNTIWFKPDHDNVIMRFLHLDRFLVKGGQRVSQGQEIAVTGNTGKLTKGPHLHLDLSRQAMVLAWPGNFTDPEKYNWDWSEPLPPAPPAPPTNVPISFWVTHLYRANWRSEPKIHDVYRDGKLIETNTRVTYSKGAEVECIDTVDGQEVTVNGVTSSKWYKSEKSGLYSSSTVVKHK